MHSIVELSRRDYWALLYAFFAVACGGLTIRALVRGHHWIQVLLLGILTIYLLSITLNRFAQVPHFKRLAAIPLGVVGIIAYVIGTSTDLPILFIFLGIGGLMHLVWDPSGTVYDTDSR